MRRAPSAVLLSVLVPLGARALPVASRAARHRPPGGAASSGRQPLHGVPGRRRDAPRVPGQRSGPRRSRARPAGGARRGAPALASLRPARRHLARHAAPADLDRRSRARTARTAGAAGPRWTSPTPRAAGEGRTARPGTEPLWVGDSDGYQVRVDVRTAARCPPACGSTWSTRAARPADGSAGAGPRRCSRPRPRPRSRSSSPGAQWGADEKLRGDRPEVHRPRSRPASCTTRRAPTATPRPTYPRSSAGSTPTT